MYRSRVDVERSQAFRSNGKISAHVSGSVAIIIERADTGIKYVLNKELCVDNIYELNQFGWLHLINGTFSSPNET